MKMSHISRNGRIGLGVLAMLIVGGLAVWLGGYGPEIGRFFAAEPGAPVPTILTALEPAAGPVGTHVIIKGENLPADGMRVPVYFGEGVIEGVSAGWYVEFDVPSEMPAYCPPGTYCTLAMLPVQPGSYPVDLEHGTLHSCADSDMGEESSACGVSFIVTGGPEASCVPLPPCAYQGEPRCAVDPLPGTVFCPPPPSGGPWIDAVSAESAIPGSQVTIYGHGFLDYVTGWGGLVVQIVLSGRGGGAWTYPDELTDSHMVFTVPAEMFPSPCTGDPAEWCMASVPLTAGQYALRVYVEGDGVPRMISNTADLAIGESVCEPLPPCAQPGANPACDLPSMGPYSRPWCPPNPTPTPTFVDNRTAELTPGFELCNAKGCMLSVEVKPNGNEVTAATVHLRAQGGVFNDTVQTNPNFPQLLESGFSTPDHMGAFFSVGIKPDTRGLTRPATVGSIGIVFDRKNLRPGGPVCVTVDLQDSRVAAKDAVGNVLSENYRNDTVCMPMPPLPSTSERPGDLDFDGDVDIYDYNIVVTNFGRRGSNPGDADHDGDTDIYDYNMVVTYFGK